MNYSYISGMKNLNYNFKNNITNKINKIARKPVIKTQHDDNIRNNYATEILNKIMNKILIVDKIAKYEKYQ